MRLGGLQKRLETLQQEKEKEREETSARFFCYRMASIGAEGVEDC